MVPCPNGGLPLYVSWDWASERHDVSVVDEEGKVVFPTEVEHPEAGLESVLRRRGEPAELLVASERPSSLIVERLLAQGHPVGPIHPNTFNPACARRGASRAESDPGDSYCLPDFLPTDGHRLRQLEPLSEVTRNLRTLVRSRDDPIEAKVAATNLLAALLDAHWPGAGVVFWRLDSEIALAFLETSPRPESAARPGEKRMAGFLVRHSSCGRRSPALLLERLQSAPVAPNQLDSEVLRELVLAQLRLLRTLLAGIASLDRAVAALPRLGAGANLSQVLAEVGPILDRAVDVEQATAECGASPVTKASVSPRRSASAGPPTRARKALHTFADNSRPTSLWAADGYGRARARGKRHPHAIRILMRAWLCIIWTCWHSDIAYDPARHGGEQRVAI
jgi:hypothetical protein